MWYEPEKILAAVLVFMYVGTLCYLMIRDKPPSTHNKPYKILYWCYNCSCRSDKLHKARVPWGSKIEGLVFTCQTCGVVLRIKGEKWREVRREFFDNYNQLYYQTEVFPG